MRAARTGLGLVSFLALSLVTLLGGVAGIILVIPLVLLPCLADHPLRSRHQGLAPTPLLASSPLPATTSPTGDPPPPLPSRGAAGAGQVVGWQDIRMGGRLLIGSRGPTTHGDTLPQHCTVMSR